MEWISNRLPDNTHDVFVIGSFKGKESIMIGWYDANVDLWRCVRFGYRAEIKLNHKQVLAWLPIPPFEWK
jgi:hypothetical protein